MKKCNILIVEDEALIAANLVHTLSSLGYAVHKPVATGEDAIRAVKARQPDLVLMDIELIGEMNGIEAAEKIRAIADIPIVYLTAYTDDLRLKQARLTEPYGYIVKPAHSRELHAMIEMALYKHSLDRKLKESEENYRNLSTMMHLMCDNMPDMIWAKDLDKRYIFANKAICRGLLNAADTDEPIGKQDMFFAERERTRHADNPAWHTFGEICRDTDQITMDAGTPQQFDEYGNVQGKYLFLDVHKAPFIDGHGKMIGTVGSARDVTESKQLQEALAESEKSYRGLFNTIRQAIYILNPDGTFVDVNEGAEAMYGYTREEFIGRTPEFLSAPGKNDLAAVMEYIRKAFAGEPQLFGFWGLRKGGEIFPKDVYLYKGTYFGKDVIVAVGADITERKVAEEALRESEEKYRDIFENSVTGLFKIHPDGAMIAVNDAFARIYDYSSAAEIIADNQKRENLYISSTLYANPEDRKEIYRILAEKGKVENFETLHCKRDGTRVWMSITARVVRDPEGTVLFVEGTILDITGRKNAEEALRNAHERLRCFVDANIVGIVFGSSSGKIIDANDYYLNIIGYTREEFEKGMVDWRAITPPEWLPADERAIEELRKRGKCTPYEKEYLRRDETRVPVSISDTLLPGPEEYIAAFIVDITERKRAEEALRQANKKLNLLSSITRHDINNQLTVQMGYLAIINRKQPDPTLNEYFQKVGTAAQRISTMIQFTKEYEKIGVNAPVWQNCRTLVDTAAKEASLGKVVVKNDFPAGTEVFADPLIFKVCYNLMDNAVRYGEKITTIRFSVEERDGDRIVVCEDDGNGVIAEEKEKIFERGFGKNTGLGLALSREILSITGITIRETGEPGKGARFEMMVPKGMWRITQRAD